ncbi:MAG: peptidoglycan DD-metalloendopeptidase family protein [Ancrocorticia sp.]
MNRKRWTSGVLAVALACAGWGSVAYATPRDNLVRQQTEQEQQKDTLQAEMEGVDLNLQQAYLALTETQNKIPAAEAELASAEAELAAAERDQQTIAGQLTAAQGELSGIQSEISTGETEIKKTRDNLAEIARAQYRGDTVPSTIELLVGSSSAKDFLNSYQTWEALSRSQATTLTEAEVSTARNQTREARQSDVEAQIGELKKKADALVVDKTNKQTAAQKKRDELAALQAKYAQQTSDLEGQKDAFQANLAAIDSQLSDTEAEIAKIDEENRRKQAALSSGDSASVGALNPGGNWLIPPIPAPLYITSPFGMRVYPFDGQMWMHNGVDLGSPCGQEQVAPANGVIAKTVPAPGNSTHGNQIFINLGMVDGSSWVAVTNHLSDFNVKPGQSVKQGEVIGWTGQTGQVTGCHVHFEVWKDGNVVDPMTFPAFTQ